MRKILSTLILIWFSLSVMHNDVMAFSSYHNSMAMDSDNIMLIANNDSSTECCFSGERELKNLLIFNFLNPEFKKELSKIKFSFENIKISVNVLDLISRNIHPPNLNIINFYQKSSYINLVGIVKTSC